MTDDIDSPSFLRKRLVRENRKFNDLEFQPLTGGVEFGKRFLYHMIWAIQNYSFDYFMRLDDDYFFCLERFLKELPMPPKKLYHWGWVHCIENIVRPEESVILLSRGTIEVFLGQDPNELYCHPWADQMIGIWVTKLRLPRFYNHDFRLHHDPPAANVKQFHTKFRNICQWYIGVHGSYPAQMKMLWKKRGPSSYVKGTLGDYTTKCSYEPVLKWKMFSDTWRYKPKLCINNPAWNTSKQMGKSKAYLGRQEEN